MPAPEVTFREGDYVTLSVVACRGVVYKVERVETFKYDTWYTMLPAYGSFGASVNRGPRRQKASEMTKLDAIAAGLENLKMQEFIRTLIKHESGATDG